MLFAQILHFDSSSSPMLEILLLFFFSFFFFFGLDALMQNVAAVQVC